MKQLLQISAKQIGSICMRDSQDGLNVEFFVGRITQRRATWYDVDCGSICVCPGILQRRTSYSAASEVWMLRRRLF